MPEPVRARRLTDQEGRRLTQIVRRGKGSSIRVRRATMIMASASGTPVPAIARLVAADEDTVRDVIHAFNARGLDALDPQWAGGRPRLISDEDVEYVVATATTRPATHGLPFTHWSVRKLAAHLARCDHRCHHRRVEIGRERLRRLLREHGVSFQRGACDDYPGLATYIHPLAHGICAGGAIADQESRPRICSQAAPDRLGTFFIVAGNNDPHLQGNTGYVAHGRGFRPIDI